jgi:hypothetical protein
MTAWWAISFDPYCLHQPSLRELRLGKPPSVHHRSEMSEGCRAEAQRAKADWFSQGARLPPSTGPRAS